VSKSYREKHDLVTFQKQAIAKIADRYGLAQKSVWNARRRAGSWPEFDDLVRGARYVQILPGVAGKNMYPPPWGGERR